MKRTTLKAASLLLAILFALSSFTVIGTAESGVLKFSENGNFTILQISDPQDDRYLAHELVGFIEKAIELSNPDLVVFTGDTVEDSRKADFTVDDEGIREGVTVKNDYGKTLSNTRATCEQIFSVVDKKGIPFAVSQGNNDYSCGVKNEDWLDIYSSFENCLVKDESDDSEGRIDYSLPIYSSDGSKTAFNIYMMDNGEDSISSEQIDWYINKSNELKAQNGESVKSFVFEHIPIAEVGNLFVKCNLWDQGAIASGRNFYKLGPDASGTAQFYYERGKSSEQFAAWKSQGDVLGAFFGHMHTDGFTGVYDGIELGVTFGCQFAKSGPYGVRVITLNENDISNYENTLYTYRNGKFIKQNSDGSNSMNFLEKIRSFFLRIFSFFRNL